MDENSNPPPPEPTPKITLFGKRMDMVDERGGASPELPREEEAEAPRGIEPDLEERRIFWTVAATFLGVFFLVFGGLWLLRGRSGARTPETPVPAATSAEPVVTPPAPAASAPATAGPTAPPSAAPAPAPPAAGRDESVAAKKRLPPYEDAEPTPSPVPAPKAVTPPQPPPRTVAHAAAAKKKPAPATRRQAAREAAAARKQAAREAAAKQASVSAAERERIRRLREEMEQYDRDKKAGRYREFPQ